MTSHTTRRLGSRVRRIVAKLAQEDRAQLDGLEVRQSGFGEWREAGGWDRRKKPRGEEPKR
jgi:hypothetical protein